ncbi:MAG: hypothetical protein ABR949_01320 [Candidatus Aquilonibacter sp.]|jgi:hypothetical protein
MLLALGGCAAAGDHREMLRAIARAMLQGALPNDGGALDTAVRGVDVAIAGLPPAVQDEIGQLFGLLEFPLTRRLMAGIGSWQTASDTDVATFLQSWRTSNAALLRSGYAALHQLVMAGWYGNDAAWPRIGYPGPPRIA